MLDKICICGKPSNKFCGACREKYYCSRECQLGDRHIHRLICTPQIVLQTEQNYIQSSPNRRNVINEPHWKRFIEILFSTQYKKAHDNYLQDRQEDGGYYELWIRVLDSFTFGEMPSDTIIGFFYLIQEPDRMFMFTVKDEDKESIKEIIVKQNDVIYKTSNSPGRSHMYTIPTIVPDEYAFVFNWEMQAIIDSDGEDEE